MNRKLWWNVLVKSICALYVRLMMDRRFVLLILNSPRSVAPRLLSFGGRAQSSASRFDVAHRQSFQIAGVSHWSLYNCLDRHAHTNCQFTYFHSRELKQRTQTPGELSFCSSWTPNNHLPWAFTSFLYNFVWEILDLFGQTSRSTKPMALIEIVQVQISRSLRRLRSLKFYDLNAKCFPHLLSYGNSKCSVSFDFVISIFLFFIFPEIVWVIWLAVLVVNQDVLKKKREVTLLKSTSQNNSLSLLNPNFECTAIVW